MPEIRAGFGRADITPPVGVDLTGYIARENPSESVLDPLSARVLALEAGRKRALLVSVECLCLEKRLGEALRRRLFDDTGVPPENILLLCTHTHSGPATVKLLGCGEMNRVYLKGPFKEGIAAAARKACASFAPCRVRHGKRDLLDWHVYRRAEDRGPSDADLVDHTARALWFEDESGETLGCFWTYTAHPTILCTKEISGDWVGDSMRRIEKATGGVAVYGQGCAGDVGPILGDDRYVYIKAMGETVADAVLESRGSASGVDIDMVEGRLRSVEVPFQRAPSRSWFEGYAAEMRTQAESEPPGIGKRAAAAMAEWASHWTMEEAPESFEAALQVLRVGPFRLVALPFEPLSAIGREIRASLGDSTLVFGYAHACHSYLAPARQYAVGGYEIHEAYRYYDLPAPWDRSAADVVVRAMVELAEREYSEQMEDESNVDRPV